MASQIERATPPLASAASAPAGPAPSPTLSTAVATRQGTRLLFIDNLRIVLITLVVIQHIAVTYGAIGSWYYRDPGVDAVTGTVLTLPVGIGQAAGMGMFFLIAAWFTPGSYDRKGGAVFLRDRIIRLGIPLLVYDLVLDPLVVYIASGLPGPYGSFYGSYLLHLRMLGNGPVWFIELLLIFTLLYAAWRGLTRHRPRAATAEALPRYRAIYAFIVGLGLVSFVVRLWWPANRIFLPLNLNVGYLPQYVSLFVVGVMAYRRNWVVAISRRMGRYWMRVALITVGALILTMIPFVLVGAEVGGSEEGYYVWVTRMLGNMMGGFNWQALYFALWESFLVVGLCIGTLTLFRERWNHQGKLAKRLAANAYAVFLIHPPVLVGFSYAFHTVALYPLLKFAVAVLVTIPLCFAVSELIRKVPGAARAL